MLEKTQSLPTNIRIAVPSVKNCPVSAAIIDYKNSAIPWPQLRVFAYQGGQDSVVVPSQCGLAKTAGIEACRDRDGGECHHSGCEGDHSARRVPHGGKFVGRGEAGELRWSGGWGGSRKQVR